MDVFFPHPFFIFNAHKSKRQQNKQKIIYESRQTGTDVI